MENIEANLEEGMSVVTELALGYGLDLVGAVLILIIGLWLAGVMQRAVIKSLNKVKHLDDTLKPFFGSLVRYAIVALTVIAVLAQFGVETTSIIAVLGAAGLAIGLALQGTLQNVAAGIMLLILRPFRVGQFVDAGGISGTVDEIGLFATQMTKVDGVQLTVPNSSLWNSPITNFSANDTRRMDVVIGISYNDDIDGAMAVMKGIMDKDDRILKDPGSEVMVTSLGDNSVNITMRAWAKTSDFWGLMWDLNKTAKIEVEKAGYSIPYPQRDVHIHQVNAG